MKLFSLIFLMLHTTLAFSAYPKPADIRFELNNSPYGHRVQLGTQLVDKKEHVLRAQWSQGAVGSTTGSISLLDVDGKAAKLPVNSIVTDCLIDVKTPITLNSTANNIPVIGFATGVDGTMDLKAQVQAANYSGVMACIPVGSAATAIKITTESTPIIKITSASYATYSSTTPSVATDGKINVLIKYILSE